MSWQRGHSDSSGLCQAWLVIDTLDTPRAALWPCLQTCLLEPKSSPASFAPFSTCLTGWLIGDLSPSTLGRPHPKMILGRQELPGPGER